MRNKIAGTETMYELERYDKCFKLLYHDQLLTRDQLRCHIYVTACYDIWHFAIHDSADGIDFYSSTELPSLSPSLSTNATVVTYKERHK